MSLLRDIQEAAATSEVKVSDVLRKAKILAARLGHAQFKEWVERELNGYPAECELPAYRIIDTASFGYFAGPFGSGLKNAPIPLSCIPKRFRQIVSHSQLMHGVSYYEDLAADSTQKGQLQAPWNADLVALVGQDIYEDMNCLYAWRRVPDGAIAAMLDTVRNKILDFVLEIEAEAPDAGEANPGERPVNQETVTQIFNTYILGGNAVVGGSIDNLQQLHVASGDLGSLKGHLATLGVSSKDMNELSDAIANDPPPSKPDEFGGKVSAWIGKMVSKAASGTWQVSTKVAGDLLSKALCSYYGLT